MAKPKRPRDTNQLAKLIADISTGESQDIDHNAGKDPVAVRRGQLGGVKGGQARAQTLSPRARSEIAKKAAKARWKKH
jgi:hypothetical protein